MRACIDTAQIECMALSGMALLAHSSQHSCSSVHQQLGRYAPLCLDWPAANS